MAEITSVINDLVETKLLTLHTAFLGTIVSVDVGNGTATVQPLTQSKQVGKSGGIQLGVLTNIPVINTARYKVTAVIDEVPHVTEISAGDIALCVACERDITDAKKGKSAVPRTSGRHQMQDAVVVGVL